MSTVARGILALGVIYTNPDGSFFPTQDIPARKDADIFAITTISIEEYNALMRGK